MAVKKANICNATVRETCDYWLGSPKKGETFLTVEPSKWYYSIKF